VSVSAAATSGVGGII